MPLAQSTRRVAAGLTALALSVTLVSACGSNGGSGGGTQASSPAASAAASGASTANSKDVTIDVKNFAFSPAKLVVSPGTKVTWKFEDSAQHTVKADNGAFESKALDNNQTYSFTFNTPGTYSYICTLHTFMKATVIVQ